MITTSILYALVASLAVAAVSLTGVFIFRNKGHITGTHRFILPLAVGVFLGIVFLELIPETLGGSPEYGAYAILAGFLGFYLLSHFLSTFHQHGHAHSDVTRLKSGARMLLLGDAIHNISDGVVIATTFLINPLLGIATTIGIMLHELPQEIAEFGVLVESGYSRIQAALRNLLTATSVVFGTILTLVLAEFMGEYVWVITGVAAGNLLYIATSDFIPELREKHRSHFNQTFFMTLIGVVLIAVLLSVSHALIENAGFEEEHAGEAH
jgi:zinc and cadmium transporter